MLFGTSVLAQTTLGVEPPVTLQAGVPGQTITMNVKVGNPSDKAVRLRAALSDWSYSQLGELQFLAVGKVDNSAAEWTRLSENVLTVPAKGSVIARYTISVPRDATPGSHWGMILFTSEPEQSEPGAPAASISVRVSHTFYVDIAPIRNTGKITGIFGRPSTEDSNRYVFAVNYQNTGNAAQVLGGRVEIRDSSGKAVAAAAFKQQVVLPGALRAMQILFSGPLPAGDYTALVILNFGDKNKDIAGEYNFTLKKPLAPG
jgi:hypothetical protein